MKVNSQSILYLKWCFFENKTSRDKGVTEREPTNLGLRLVPTFRAGSSAYSGYGLDVVRER